MTTHFTQARWTTTPQDCLGDVLTRVGWILFDSRPRAQSDRAGDSIPPYSPDLRPRGPPTSHHTLRSPPKVRNRVEPVIEGPTGASSRTRKDARPKCENWTTFRGSRRPLTIVIGFRNQESPSSVHGSSPHICGNSDPEVSLKNKK